MQNFESTMTAAVRMQETSEPMALPSPRLLRRRALQRALALGLAAFAAFTVPHTANAAPLQEDFSADPASAGWRVFGDTNLFLWNAAGENLQVTWDSSKSNSYFYYPLDTILGRDDDFQVELDLWLDDIASGHEPGKTGGFQIAFGFLNLAAATAPDFMRGVFGGAPNIGELDYFPAGFYPDFGPVDATLSPTFISRSGDFASGFNYPYELPTNQWVHITLTYTASNQTLVTVLTNLGGSIGPVDDVVLTNYFFSDFRLNAFSINSYSSAGNDFDSVLAHGTIDNIVLTVPPSPVQEMVAGFTNGVWEVQFTGRSNWIYTLDRTVGFQGWTNVSPAIEGSADTIALSDTNAPADNAYYRVNAERP